MNPAGVNELNRACIRWPNAPTRTFRLFADWQRAVEHLSDHVLTEPECQGWAIVLADRTLPLQLDDKDARWRYAQQSHQPRGGQAQSLFDLYTDCIRKATDDAHRLGWHGENDNGSVMVGLGTNGVLVLIEESFVVTAFLPGAGEASATREAREQAGMSRSALPRERGMRTRRSGGADRELRQQQHRQQNWSHEEQLYYLVFRPAVQFIRSRYHSSRDLTGRLRCCDYALLKDSLPPLSQLRLQNWQQFRR